jgi:hypothetical protein
MRISLRLIAAGLVPLLLMLTLPAQAAKIAVIGTGNVGSALGPEFAALGHTIVYGSRTPTEKDVTDLVAKTGHGATATTQPEAVKGADIVVLAVPGNLAVQITQSLGDLSGKVIIDPTNRVNRSSADGYANHDVPGGSNVELGEDGRSRELGRSRLDSARRRRRGRARHGRRAHQGHGARARGSRAAAVREYARRDARDLGERPEPRRCIQLSPASGAAGAAARALSRWRSVSLRRAPRAPRIR